MTKEQITAVQHSWEKILKHAPTTGIIFYTRLFAIDPSLKSLFPGNVSKQAAKLMSMITFAVRRLDNLSEVVEEIKDLGKRHKGYRVEPSMYNTVGEALLWTLEQGLGKTWNSDLKEAWTKVYVLLSSTMIEASK
jgi:hemoglobin-like flavoprotein